VAKRKNLKTTKISNILDSYIEFSNMDDEQFRKAFRGPKDTIINSWLYLLYLELKSSFESQDGSTAINPYGEKQSPDQDGEDQRTGYKAKKKSVSRKKSVEEHADQTDNEDIFGVSEKLRNEGGDTTQ
jgi:hypothetical protein